MTYEQAHREAMRRSLALNKAYSLYRNQDGEHIIRLSEHPAPGKPWVCVCVLENTGAGASSTPVFPNPNKHNANEVQ